VFHAEGSEQVNAFLQRHTDAVLLPSPGHLLPGTVVVNGEFNDNVTGGYDGFFYARIDKAGP
jgi:16S rRNA (cytosine967-C5)-methyltransferase